MVLEDATDRMARRLAVEEQKNKDTEKKRAREKRATFDALEKHRLAHEREGVPLEASPSTEDDEEEGMKVWMGFNLETRL